MDSNNEQTAVQSEQQTESGDITIDLGRIFRAIWHYLWLIIVVAFLGAVIMYGYTKLFIADTFTSTATVYMANTSGESVTSSDSYVANAMSTVIKSRTTLEQAIEQNDLPYEYDDISECVSVSVGSAGILTITVEYSDANSAAEIANAILSVLEDRATEVFKGTIYVSVVDYAVAPEYKSAPSTLKNVLIGGVAGAAISCVIIVLLELLNNKIYNNDYLITTYNIPVLTEIPDFADKKSDKKNYAKYGYGEKA